MDPHAGKIVINGATSQDDRWLPALAPGYAQVDERSLYQLLEFPVAFGSLINFFDLNDTVDGDWAAFFVPDPTIIMASIVALDLKRIETGYFELERRTLEAKRFDRKFELFCGLFDTIVRVARSVNLWLEATWPRPQSAAMLGLRRQLVAMIESDLAPALRQLIAYAQGAAMPPALGRGIPLDTDGFLPIWDLRCDCPDDSIYRGGSRARKIDHACPYIDNILLEFVEAIADLQTSARGQFDASLQTQDHRPHIALYIAFAELFANAQRIINTMSERYVRFYYHDILREDFRAAIPDSVYLTATLAADQGVDSATIPRGTLFAAGRDNDGFDILYAADKSLFVTAAAIAGLRALRVVRGPLFEPPPGHAGPAPDVVMLRLLGTDIAPGKPGAGEAGAWDTFGAAVPGNTDVTVTTPATLGFAIASPYLMLSGGARTVTLRLTCSDASAAMLAKLVAQIAAATGLAANAILHDVLDAAFDLSVSTAAGWLAIETADVLLNDGANRLGLRFKLPPAAAAVAAYDPAGQPAGAAPTSGGANPDPTQPTLKVALRHMPVIVGTPPDAVAIQPLSLLGVLELTDWALEICVSQLADLQLSNTDGSIDPTKPFLPLGAPPVVGSFLEIRHPELFAKTLTSLDLSITWFNLPPNEDGFKGWYRDYVLGLDGKPQDDLFDNQTFRVGICVVNPGLWNLAGEKPGSTAVCTDVRYCLFRTKDPENKLLDCTDCYPAAALCPTTDFNTLTVAPSTQPPYYDAATSAIRVQLTAPSYAFGDTLYPQNVLAAVISDLPDPTGAPKSGPARCQKWKVLWDAAQWIRDCLAQCDGTGPDGYQACITPRLEICGGRIVQAAIACLLDCLAGDKATLGDARYEQLRATLIAVADPSPAEQAKHVMQWITELPADCAPSAALTECMARCAMLLNAVLCGALCEAEAGLQPPDKYKESLTKCLATCIAQLEQPYLDCCKDIIYPNAPWLPQAQGVAVTYKARCDSATSPPERRGRFYYLLPFDGYAEPPQSLAPAFPLLPAFPDAGTLYIGFFGLAPPQSLTLLFGMAAASAAGWTEHPPPVTWSYLSRNRWTPLTQTQVLADGTNGLQNSGILALNLPAYDAGGNSVLDPDAQWLSAGVVQGADLFPQTSRIVPHALLATWQDNGGGAHLVAPLPAGTIKGAVEPLPDIATIDQPMPSFGGRAPETGRSFQTAIGERLRHKDRGLLGWDYERLVLERFPAVWKVQTLPARDAKGPAPGSTLVVVVPGANNIDVMDPTAPLASADMLGRIGAALETAISPFVDLHVTNPLYVRIAVTATVQFITEEDPGTCIRRLDQELTQYLSPWFYDAARAAKGGDYANEDEIAEFIETRPYVDALIAISFGYAPDPSKLDWYFLTSAKQHHITAGDTASAARQSRTESVAGVVPAEQPHA